MSVLEVKDLSIHFGGIKALQGVNLRAGEWEIVGIIGPNGAGKTTLFNCITGFYAPTAGRVLYRGRDISRLPVHKHPYPRVVQVVSGRLKVTNLDTGCSDTALTNRAAGRAWSRTSAFADVSRPSGPCSSGAGSSSRLADASHRGAPP